MKLHPFVMLLLATCALIATSCSPESVSPRQHSAASPLVLADETDHPGVDPICSEEIEFPMATPQGGFVVDYCGQAPCSFGEPWGSAVLFNDTASLFANLTMAEGWYIKKVEAFLDPNSLIGTTAVVPQPGTGWLSIDLDPVESIYQLEIPVPAGTPTCFEVALSMQVVQSNFFDGEDPDSQTELRVVHMVTDNNGAPAPANPNMFVVPWCFATCGPELTEITDGDCQGCNSENTVTFYDCDSISVSSCKDLSNVVLVYDDCSWQKYDGLSGQTGSFTGTGIHTGKTISHVYIKSGCYQSGEGPGFGRRFDGPCLNNLCSPATGKKKK